MLHLPHHDPSEHHVSDPAPGLGDTVTVSLDVAPGSDLTRVLVRSVRDGEAAWSEARFEPGPEGPGGPGGRWRADVRCHNPVTRYRFWLDGPGGPRWLTGRGVLGHDPLDHHDFTLLAGSATPAWVPETVWYQIFPDRFASSGRHAAHRPPWAVSSRWGEPVADRAGAMSQLYGGDLDGVVDHLDHLIELGVGGIYLNPVFPGRSNHRYDAVTFDHVDPVLGGDEALVRLADACRRAGLRLISDLTLNHTGDHHDWFRAARGDPAAEEAGYYYFTEHPDRYVSWLDVPSLPKLDHGSEALRRRLYDGAGSVLARYLQPPFGLDGWRIDAANMAGRLAADDHGHLVAATARRTAEAAGPGRWLVAEHFFDPTGDAIAGGWHGFMNYAGASRPVASWLGDEALLATLTGGPGQAPRAGRAVARAMDEVRTGVPWTMVLGSLALLGSHDTPRWRSLARSPELARVGVGLVLTLPGSPCFLYGDEIGLTGTDAEQARAPMPWDRSAWDTTTLAWYRELVRFRSASRALAHGGFRWVERADDALAFLRSAGDERLLVRATRAGGAPPLPVDLALLGAHGATLVAGAATHSVERGRLRAGSPGDGPSFAVWRLEPA